MSSDDVRARRWRRAPEGGLRVAVVSIHGMVGQVVAAGLARRGMQTTALTDLGRLSGAGVRVRLSSARADLVVHVGGLRHGADLATVLWLHDQHEQPWLVSFRHAPGSAAGALLESGVEVVRARTLAELAQAIRSVHAGQHAAHEDVRRRWASLWAQEPVSRRDLLARLRTLSVRERQVLAGLHRGEDVRRVANRLGSSPDTVRTQVRAVLRKLGVESQVAAVWSLEQLQDWTLGIDVRR